MSRRAPPAFVQRMYNYNLRPVVLGLAAILGFWALAWAIGNFKEINDEKHEGFTRLATFALILGILYLIVAIIEFFGAVAAILQRLALIRLFATAHLLAALLAIAAGFMRVILHFMLKSDMLNDCEKAATGQSVDFTWGIWGPHVTETLSATDAANWCRDAYNRDSWQEIIFLIIVILVMGTFSMTVWAYANRTGTSITTAPPPSGAGPNPYYQPPYASQDFAPPPHAPSNNRGYTAPTLDYAPPAGPPPMASADELPGYGVGAYEGKDISDAKTRDDKDAYAEDPFADWERTRK